MTEGSIRGDLTDSARQPMKVAVKLYRLTQGGVVPIGTVGSPDAPADNAPTASDDTSWAASGQVTPVDVLLNDHDPDGTLDPASVAVSVNPANGTVSVNPTTGAITYTPNSGFAGIDTFRYTVEDNQGAASNEATITLVVLPRVTVESVEVNGGGPSGRG
jgi:hypothetical protein